MVGYTLGGHSSPNGFSNWLESFTTYRFILVDVSNSDYLFIHSVKGEIDNDEKFHLLQQCFQLNAIENTLIYKYFLYFNQLFPTWNKSAAEKSRQKYGKSVNRNMTTGSSYCYVTHSVTSD